MRAPKVSDFANKKNLILIVLTSILFLFIFGITYYLIEEKSLKEEKYKELSTIAKIKLEQITDWREERIYEAKFYAKIDRLIKSTQGLINNHNDSEIKNYLQELLYPTKTSHGYENIFISDIHSNTLFSLDSIYSLADSITALNISKAIKKDSLLFEDFHFCSVHNKIHLDIISPIKDYDNKIIAAIVFRINPADYFFPMIQKWPVYSKTAESVLVKNEGHQIRVLSQLRNNQNDKMLFTIPIEEKKYVSVKGALGQKGIIEGQDYGNKDVIADLNSITGTNWFIVTKMAREEFYSELIFRTIAITLLAIFVLLLIISTAVYLSKIRSSLIYKNLFLKEKELNEFQKISKAITDVAQDAIIMINPEGNISFWNPAAENIFGYKPQEIMGKNLHNLMAPKHYHAQHQEAFNKFKVTGEGNAIGKVLILNAIKKNGDEISIDLSLSAIKINDEWHAVGIIRDISERKQTEEKLRESEEKFRKAFNTSTDSITITRLSDGLILDVNNGFYLITGFSKTDIAGKTIADLSVWHDMKEREKVVQKLMQNGMVENIEAKFITKDGKVLNGLFSASLIDINGEPYIISMTRDITARKEIEASLKVSEELFRHSFNYSAAGMCIIGIDGKFQKINNTFTKILGYTESELSSYHFNDITYPDDISIGISRFNLMLEDVIKIAEFEKRYIAKDKKIVWMHVTTSLIRDLRNDPKFFITQIIDITERKSMEIAIKQSEENYRHIINGMNDMVFVSDLNGQFIHVNDAVSEKLGYSKEELIKMSPFDIDASLKKDQISNLIQNLDYDKIQNFETYHRSKNGDVFPVEIRTTIINYQGKKVILDIARDISERKKTELLLKQSEENYRHIINGMNDMVFVIDMNGKFLDVNNSALEALGYTKEELLQLGPTDIDNNLSKDAIAGLINSIPLDEVQSFETSHRTKAGTTIPVEIKSTMIPYKGNRVILSIVRNISERKEAHTKIMESEERYRTMITQMQLGVAVHEMIFDDSGTPVDYRFIDVNPSYEKLTGLQKEKIIGKHVLEILPELESHWIEKFGYVALTGEPLHFEDYTKELNRHYSVVAYRPRPRHFAVIIDDISDRKTAETELIERMNEISRFNNLMIGREEKMIELKKEINKLLEESGQEKKYDVISESN